MKKKVLAALLSATMVMGMMTGCGNADPAGGSAEGSAPESSVESSAEESAPESSAEESVVESSSEVVEEPAGPALAEAEALPDAFAHITFDGDDEGYSAVVQAEKAADSINDGGTYDVVPVNATFGYSAGPVGQALYLDGSFGLNLGLEPTNTDAYTVSFWTNADRLSTFGPTLTMGYDMGKAADAGNDVTWLNVTQSEWGENSAKIFPIAWSRNEASNAADGTVCFPWMYSFDNEIHGKREWVMVTIVASGEEQHGAAGTTTVGAQFYVNGVKMYDSQDNYENATYFEYTWDATLAPNIMKPGDKTFESWFGINYWDTVFKGFVDDLYVYDTALTAGQVASLYLLGDPTVESVAPDGTAIVEEAEPVAADHSDVTTTGTVVGATDCSTPFWTEFSEPAAVPSGESVVVNFVNYGDQLANWHNALVVLQNVEAAHSADDNADYAEYAVLRMDNWGWGAGYDGIATAECDWNWETFVADADRANVEMTITNNGDTADVVLVFTTAEGATYNQSYKGIAVTGDLYYCFTVENAFIDIQ